MLDCKQVFLWAYRLSNVVNCLLEILFILFEKS